MKQILYTPQGIWKFYHDARLGICFYAPNAKTPMILFEQGAADYDVVCDESGNLFLICQDDKNSIHLLDYNRKKWSRQCILEAKNHIPYAKQFRLLNINGWLQAFYSVRHNNQYLLAHHLLNENTKPNIIETYAAPFTYTVLTDNAQNIHLLYEKNGELLQKTYIWQSKTWLAASTICTLSDTLVSLCAVFDPQDTLHTVLCTRSRQNYNITYISEQHTQKILYGLEHPASPVLFYHNQYHILFHMAGRLLHCAAEPPKILFSKPAYYFPGSFAPHSIGRLCSAQSLQRYGIYATEIYGIEARGNRFEPTLLEDALNEIDFSMPHHVQEAPSELNAYMQSVSPFQAPIENTEA